MFLFDLEWVIYNSKNQTFCEWFKDIYFFAKDNSITTAIATWADNKELELINKSISIKRFFWKNIFSTSNLWYKTKQDSRFFKEILETMNISAKNVLLIDDWKAGIIWAQAVWINTYYVNKSEGWNARNQWQLKTFLTFYRNNNDWQNKNY